MNKILEAAQFAERAHQGQHRKYNGTPYIWHPMRVAGRVMLLKYVPEHVVVAAWLHDVLEDCPYTYDDLAAPFDHPAALLVQQLTNPSRGLMLPRKDRKAIDREHLAKVSYWAKYIKLIDRIDNLRELASEQSKFCRLYAEESLSLSESLLMPDYDARILHRELTLLATNMRDS